MAYYIIHIVFLFLAAIDHSIAMNTCSEKNGSIFLKNERLKGSFLEHLASKYYWAALGTDPDKTGFTSIFLEFGDLNVNDDGELYLFLSITRTSSNLTSEKIEAKWTQHDSDRFFDAVYPDGQYNIYHFFYKGLVVFHRCSVKCIEDGNVSFAVFAPIDDTPEETKQALDECRKDLLSKFPSASVIYMNYPILIAPVYNN